MTNVQEYLSANSDAIFPFFNQVHLFGSNLDSDTYDDIDLLLVYGNQEDLPDVSVEVHKALCKLASTFSGTQIDLTVLSERELEGTDFLRKIERHVTLR